MPPKGKPLKAAQIELLARWIDQGAGGPADSPPSAGDRRREHWSFQPIAGSIRPRSSAAIGREVRSTPLFWRGSRPPACTVTRGRPLHAHSSAQPGPVGPASYDPGVDRFLADTGGDAYERLVDRLLASPHYGERWGRHWLDVARYADSNG